MEGSDPWPVLRGTRMRKGGKEQCGRRGYGEGDADDGDSSQCSSHFRDWEMAQGSKSSLGLGRQMALVEVFILLLVDLGQTTTLSESQGHHRLTACAPSDSCGTPSSEGTWNVRVTQKTHTHGRLLITTTPVTLPDAKSLCGGTVRSSPCFP